MTSRRVDGDIDALYKLDQDRFSIKFSDPLVRKRFRLKIHPAFDLSISDICEFDVVISDEYPEDPPSVYYIPPREETSKRETEKIISELPLDIDTTRDNFVVMRITQYHGWSSIYGLDCVIYALRRALRNKSAPPSTRTISSRERPSAHYVSRSGLCERQGQRRSMEDASVCLENLCSVQNGNPQIAPIGLYAVFDGHGGSEASNFAARTFPSYVAKYLKDGVRCSEALYRAFEDTEGLFLERVVVSDFDGDEEDAVASDTASKSMTSTTTVEPRHRRSDPLEGSIAGSCAVCVLLDSPNDRMVVANIGDSRAVLCRGGKAIALTRDHKPTCPDEIARIVQAGGFVSMGRTNGQLAVSRSLGDYTFKVDEIYANDGFSRRYKRMDAPIVSAQPEITVVDFDSEDDFLIVACDGLFDVMSNDDVVKFVIDAAAEKMNSATIDDARGGMLRNVSSSDLSSICSSLVDHAINTLKSRDNVTAIIVALGPYTTSRSSGTTDTGEKRDAFRSERERSDERSNPLKISLDAPPLEKLSSIDELLEYASSPSHRAIGGGFHRKSTSPTSSASKERARAMKKSISDLDDSGLLDYLLDDSNFSSP